MNRKFALSLLACGIILTANQAAAQIIPEAPRLLNSNGTADAADDTIPEIRSDRAGVWVTAWQSLDSVNDTLGPDLDIFFSRSTDAGVTWSLAGPLNPSSDTDDGNDFEVALATDGSGVWIAVWHSESTLGDRIDTDDDILYSVSTDGGVTWSPAAELNTNAETDAGNDTKAAIATDGAGVWIVVWQSDDTLGDTVSNDFDILMSISEDNGTTWSAPEGLADNAGADSLSDQRPAIATDGAGRWVVVWDSNENIGGNGFDTDVISSVSADKGVTWSSPANMTNPSLTDSGSDFNIDLAVTPGAWRAVWESNENIFNAIGTDRDVFIARSGFGIAPWTDGVINTDASTDGTSNDTNIRIANDGGSNWVVVYAITGETGTVAGDDGDVLAIHSGDGGTLFSDPQFLNLNGSIDINRDEVPALDSDGMGNWVAVWASEGDVRGAGNDRDILVSTFEIGTATELEVSGDIALPGGAPASCAVIEAVIDGGGTTSVSVTDLQGEYLLTGLETGTYDLRIFTPDFGDVSAGTTTLGGSSLAELNFDLVTGNLERAVSGTILDDDTSEPLVTVLVEALFNDVVVAETYSCATGAYVIQIPDISKGIEVVDLRYSLPNYETKLLEGVNVPLEGIPINETLTKAVPFEASLTGVVSSITKGSGIANARVTLRGQANVSAITDGTGAYSFDAILGGTYTIAVSAQGFESKSFSRTVGAMEAAVESVVLRPIAGQEPDEGDPSDVDENGEINSSDIQLVINAVLGLDIGGLNADVTGDNDLNASDIQTVINTVLGV